MQVRPPGRRRRWSYGGEEVAPSRKKRDSEPLFFSSPPTHTLTCPLPTALPRLARPQSLGQWEEGRGLLLLQTSDAAARRPWAGAPPAGAARHGQRVSTGCGWRPAPPRGAGPGGASDNLQTTKTASELSALLCQRLFSSQSRKGSTLFSTDAPPLQPPPSPDGWSGTTPTPTGARGSRPRAPRAVKRRAAPAPTRRAGRAWRGRRGRVGQRCELIGSVCERERQWAAGGAALSRTQGARGREKASMWARTPPRPVLPLLPAPQAAP